MYCDNFSLTLILRWFRNNRHTTYKHTIALYRTPNELAITQLIHFLFIYYYFFHCCCCCSFEICTCIIITLFTYLTMLFPFCSSLNLVYSINTRRRKRITKNTHSSIIRRLCRFCFAS